MTDTDQSHSAWDRLAWFGTIVIGLLCLARAMVEHDPFPWWASDPFVFSPPITGLTPRWALLLNAGLMGTAALTLFAHARRGYGIKLPDTILLAIGLGVIGYHTAADLERTLDASTIGAVICVFIAASKIQTLPGAVRVLGATLVTFPILLVCIGLYEVFVSHPETVRLYEQSRDSFFAARGWSEGSFEAMAYERRLRNPEPLAWFGLTNVFASFVAAGGAALLTLAFARFKDDRNIATLAALGGLVCGFGVFLCGSKGGYGIFVVGVMLGALITYKPYKLINGKAIIALCVLVLLGLVLRGIIGEGLGERSLLFRSYYLQGSLSIWLENPVFGSGPGMFQDQYALLKPELSPEDVATPHSVWFAWLATLGLGGVALIALVVSSIARTKLTTNETETGFTETERTNWTKLALVLCVLPLLFALRMQTAVLSAQELVPLLIGLVLWCGASVLIVRSHISDQQIRAAVFVLACVLMVHAMIEVTGSFIVSAPLWALMIGMSLNSKQTKPSQSLVGLITPIVIMVSAAVALVQWPSINKWERDLHNAAESAASIADIHSALDALEFSTTPQQDIQQIASVLSSITGQQVSPSFDSIIPALNEAEVDARSQSIGFLERSLEARPSHTPTRIAISQQIIWLASLNQSTGNDAQAAFDWESALSLFAGEDIDTKGRRWASSISAGRTRAYPEDPNRDQWLQAAIEHAQAAFEGTPHDPKLAFRIMQLGIELDDQPLAANWAQRAMDIHERMRLDPLRGLNPDEIQAAEAVIRQDP